MMSNLLTLKLSGLSVSEIDLSIVESIRQDLDGFSELFSSVMEAAYIALTKKTTALSSKGKTIF